MNLHYRLLALFTLVLVFNCDDTEEIETEILDSDKITINSGIENDDVNAPGYWDNTSLAWSEEFDGIDLNTDKWGFSTRNAGQDQGTELVNYRTNENINISNGTLKILAKKVGSGQNIGDYTSARLVSKYAFKYGKMEVRAKIPEDKGNGLIARLWMLGENRNTVGYPTCGEVDMLGYLSHIPNTMYAALHTTSLVNSDGSALSTNQIELENIEEEFHIYGVLLTDEYIKFYVDNVDNVILTYNRPSESTDANWPFDQGFYFIMNVGVGGKWAGVQGVDDTIFPTEMEIDYVRVYHPQ